MDFLEPKPEWIDDIRNAYKNEIPGMEFETHQGITNQILSTFQDAVDEGDENNLHRVIVGHPSLLACALSNTGHHGIWYRSKPQIGLKTFDDQEGHIPDFLLAARNSNGLSWHVVELKRSDAKVTNVDATGLSTDANHGVTQLMRYLRYMEEHQGTLRDTLKIQGFQTPQQGLLIIGTEEETELDEKKKRLKSTWNKYLNNIELTSYSRILRKAQDQLGSTHTILSMAKTIKGG